MNPPSTSSSTSSSAPIQVDVLCGAIEKLRETYHLAPAENGKIFVEGSPDTVPNLSHIALHKLQFSLLEECKELVRVLYRINKSTQADFLMIKIIMHYYDVFQYSPVEYRCDESKCKAYAASTIRAIQIMKRCI